VSFWLPGHKADKFFEGNRLIIRKSGVADTCTLFTTYLKSRDSHFPLRPELWLRANGTIPTRSSFIARLRKFFPNCIAGKSMRAGGATEAGIAPNLMQTAGRWTSETFTRYHQRDEPILVARKTLTKSSTYVKFVIKFVGTANLTNILKFREPLNN
jgi:hypothetical protein